MAVDTQKQIRQRGQWVERPQPRYATGDVVLHEGRLWVLTGTSSGQGAPDANTNWERFALHDLEHFYQGNWEAGKSYNWGDIVFHLDEGVTYIALGPTSADPATSSEWHKFSDRGRDGDTGEPGKDGDRGEPGERGDSGQPGQPGADGKSAYQVAVDGGFSGNEAAWLASLKGADGAPGKDGKDGQQGQPGERGESGQQGPEGPPGAPGQPGASGKDGSMSAGWRGVWDAATAAAEPYAKDAVVQHQGRVLLATKNALVDGTPPHQDDAWVTLLPAELPAGFPLLRSRAGDTAVFHWTPVTDWGVHVLERAVDDQWVPVTPQDGDAAHTVTVTDVRDGDVFRLAHRNAYGDQAISEPLVVVGEVEDAEVFTPVITEVRAESISEGVLDWEHPDSEGVRFAVYSLGSTIHESLGADQRSARIRVPDGGTGDVFPYTVTASSADGRVVRHSMHAAITYPPARTTTLTATHVRERQVDLAWVAVEGATGYEVARKDGTAQWTTVAQLGVNETGWSDTGVEPGVTYRYWVRVRAGGNRWSAWSAEALVPVWGRVPVPVVSGEVRISDGRVPVRWTYTDAEQKYPLRSITLRYRYQGEDTQTVELTPDTTEWVSEPLEIDSTAEFTATATTVAGDVSDRSPLLRATRAKYAEQGGGLRVTAAYPGNLVDLAWNTAPTADSYELIVGNGEKEGNFSEMLTGTSRAGVRLPAGHEWISVTPLRYGERGVRSPVVRIDATAQAQLPWMHNAVCVPDQGRTLMVYPHETAPYGTVERAATGSSTWTQVKVGELGINTSTFTGGAPGDKYRLHTTGADGRRNYSREYVATNGPGWWLWEAYGFRKNETREVYFRCTNFPPGHTFRAVIKKDDGSEQLFPRLITLDADGVGKFPVNSSIVVNNGQIWFFPVVIGDNILSPRAIFKVADKWRGYFDPGIPVTVRRGEKFWVTARFIAPSGLDVRLRCLPNGDLIRGHSLAVDRTTGWLDGKWVQVQLDTPGQWKLQAYLNTSEIRVPESEAVWVTVL